MIITLYKSEVTVHFSYKQIHLVMASNDQRYNIIISGPIGAGKSTLITNIAKYYEQKGYDYGIIPEYIDGMEDGPQKLDDWISGKISLQEFQDYITASSDVLNKLVENKPFKIYERVPIEGAEIFSKDSEIYPRILNQANALHEKYSIPNMFHQAPYSMYINANQNEKSVFKRVKKIIEKDLKHNIPWRLIYLRVDPNTSSQRVLKRGRDYEMNYDSEYLQKIINRYEQLFFKKD